MLKILLPVDGSPSAVRATQTLIETIGWYREAPSIDVLSVHLPVPRVPNLGSFVSRQNAAIDSTVSRTTNSTPCEKPAVGERRARSTMWSMISGATGRRSKRRTIRRRRMTCSSSMR